MRCQLFYMSSICHIYLYWNRDCFMLAQASSYMSYIMEGQYKSRLLAFVRGNGVVISGTSKITNATSNGGQTMHLKRIVYFCIVLQKNVYN